MMMNHVYWRSIHRGCPLCFPFLVHYKLQIILTICILFKCYPYDFFKYIFSHFCLLYTCLLGSHRPSEISPRSSHWIQTPPRCEAARVFVCGAWGSESGWSLSHRRRSRKASLPCEAWNGSWGLKLLWNSCHTQDSQTSPRSGFSHVLSSDRTGWSSCRTRSSGRAARPCVWADVCSWLLSGRSSSHSRGTRMVSHLCGLSGDLWVDLSGWTAYHTDCTEKVSPLSEFAYEFAARTSYDSLFHRAHSSKNFWSCCR